MKKLIISLLLIWIFCCAFENQYIVKNFENEYFIEIEIEDNDGDEYSGLVKVKRKVDNQAIIEQRFIDYRIFGRGEMPIGKYILIEDQNLINCRDKNFDGKDDIIVSYQYDGWRHYSSIFVNIDNKFVYDSLTTQAYNWWDLEINEKRQIVYGNGFNSSKSITSCDYIFKDGKVFQYVGYGCRVLSNNFINVSTITEYKNGRVTTRPGNSHITTDAGAQLLFSFKLKDSDLEANFATSDRKLHFALTDEYGKVDFYYPKKYPYDSAFSFNPFKQQLSFATKNKEYKVNMVIKNDSIVDAEIEIIEEDKRHIYKATNIIEEKIFDHEKYKNVMFDYR